MADITPYKSVSISTLMADLDTYKYNPSAIQRIILDYLSEVTNGEVDIVDPTNPFVFLLESAAVATAIAVQETTIALRKQYPSLALTQEDLYLHMSDRDFINRFAVPASTVFTVVIQLQDLYTRLVYDPIEQCSKVTIPRDTEFTIDDIVFTLQYPVSIRRFDNGIVQVSYDASILSPLQTLSSNIIDYVVRRDGSSLDWMFFQLPVQQLAIATTYFPVQLSSMFAYPIAYTNQYCYARVFYRNTATLDLWVELIVTHTDQVFDPLHPTAILQVYKASINVSIPKIYMTSGLVSGDVRVDVYTTKGELTISLSNYKLTSFGTRLRAIDEARDLNEYTNALVLTTYYTYSDATVSGGSNGIDFDTLRTRVLNNAIGDRQLPITNNQLIAYVSNLGFDLVRNVDTITNRIFLATQKLPKPISRALITAANIGIGTFNSTVALLSSIDTVRIHPLRQTILSHSIFHYQNGIIEILSAAQRMVLASLPKSEFLALVNSESYLYNPFYYVLDRSTTEFSLRAYNLDYPVASNLSFISQNQTLQLPVNTALYTLEHTVAGYKLTITTKSGSFYKQLEDELVQMQLAYTPTGESQLAYVNGTYIGLTTTQERIYEFLIATQWDINADHQLAVTGHMFSNDAIDTWVALELPIHLFYTTTSLTDTYIPDASDAMIGRFILPDGAVCVTHETLTLRLGSSLSNLWSRARSFATGLEYARYVDDVPMMYSEVVYDVDPHSGSIFSVVDGTLSYSILHQIGDPVLDDLGMQVYSHHKGDVILDAVGDPTVISAMSVDQQIDILLVDGKYEWATDAHYVAYRSEIASILDTWITKDLVSIQSELLEQTRVYFYPKTTIGMVKVYVEDGVEDMILSEQSMAVALYVDASVYLDTAIRLYLQELTISILDTYIDRSTINITDITTALQSGYGNSVQAVVVSGLGDGKDYKVINLAAEHNRLSLRKRLVQQHDGTMIIQEDVAVSFYNVSRTL